VIAAYKTAENSNQKTQAGNASSLGKLRPGKAKNFVLEDFNPGIVLPAAVASGCDVDSPPRFSLQTEIGTVHIDEYRFPYGCFGTTKTDALFGVGFVIPQNGTPPLGFRYRKGGRGELLEFLKGQ